MYIIQSDCELKGVFKILPYEKSIFHFTDHTKTKDICVWYEEYDYSGPISLTNIDTGTDIQIRLWN